VRTLVDLGVHRCRSRLGQILIATMAFVPVACAHHVPRDDEFARQLGESTASPGSDPSRRAPIASDDPSVINVSKGIRMRTGVVEITEEAEAPSTEPQPQVIRPGVVVITEPSHPRPQPTPRDEATSSTPVDIQRDIAPRSTTEIPDQPGVYSAPPPPPGYR